MPTDLWDLTGEDWKGKVAVQNPRTSTPGRAFLAATVDYFENDADNSTDYSDWWSAMNDNDIIITNGWSESYLQYYEAGYGVWDDSFIGGAHATVSYCHSPGAEAYWGSGATNSVALNISGASFLQVEYAGIASGPGVNIEGAKVFLELLLSNSIQSTIPDTNVMYPVLSHLSIPEGAYSDHTAEPVDASISMQRIATEMHGWLTEWDLVMA
jgi:thiamine transport system substrate-binding protein